MTMTIRNTSLPGGTIIVTDGGSYKRVMAPTEVDSFGPTGSVTIKRETPGDWSAEVSHNDHKPWMVNGISVPGVKIARMNQDGLTVPPSDMKVAAVAAPGPFVPDTPEWAAENRRLEEAGLAPMVAPTAQYRLRQRAYTSNAIHEAGEVVIMPVHMVKKDDPVYELVVVEAPPPNRLPPPAPGPFPSKVTPLPGNLNPAAKPLVAGEVPPKPLPKP